MKYFLCATLLLLAACGGTLSDEQRKKMKEQMELHKIRRVTDAEITEAGYTKGRDLVTGAKKSGLATKAVTFHADSTTIQNDIERQIFLAYAESQGSSTDNLQKLRLADGTDSDSLLYTQPSFENVAGNQTFRGMWSVWLSRKQLILEMPKKK